MSAAQTGVATYSLGRATANSVGEAWRPIESWMRRRAAAIESPPMPAIHKSKRQRKSTNHQRPSPGPRWPAVARPERIARW